MPSYVTLTHPDAPDWTVTVPEGKEPREFAESLAEGNVGWSVKDNGDSEDAPPAAAVSLPQKPATPAPNKPASPVDVNTETKES